MFTLVTADNTPALNRAGQPFTYTSRDTARIAARVLSKHHKTVYTVTKA